MIKLINQNKTYQLIDIREKEERKIYINDAEYHLLKEIEANPKILKLDCPIILYCQTGKRTMLAIQEIRQNINQKNVYFLIGGIVKWKE